MNDRFLLLPQERQKTIINAAYKVFASNKYRKAPMSEISNEGGISKALLFHYFGNKLGLYMYLWDEAIRVTTESVKEFQAVESDDLFEILKRSMVAKCSIMRRYPYLSLFLINAFYENDEKVKEDIGHSFEKINNESFNLLLSKVDTSKLREDFTLQEIYLDVVYASDGFMVERYRSERLDADEMEIEYGKLVDIWRRAYGK